MRRRDVGLLACVWTALLMTLAPVGAATARGETVAFDSDRWEITAGQVVEHLGRQSLIGAAHLEDVEFTNGVIEVDIAVNGSRSYPGLVFRRQSDGEYERFYIRPHRAGLYPDALQYTPVCNGVTCWQLYSGEGFTAGAALLENEWIHLKLEVNGSQARVYLGDFQTPALVIDSLKHGVSSGGIGVMGPPSTSAHFSNFSYRVDDSLEFPEPTTEETPPGTITNWEISSSFKTAQANRTAYPRFFQIFFAGWEPVSSEPSGLVNVSRLRAREGQDADCVLARTIFRSDEARRVQLSFGYSDEVHLFLNGKLLFTGNSAYRSRDPSFVGAIGYHDAIYLDLQKGLNEILLMVSEGFGGWGFMGKTDSELAEPVRQHRRLTKVWETLAELLTPESVLHDRKRDVLYVTSFDVRYDARNQDPEKFTGYISKVKLDGTIDELKWVTKLNAPAGMCLRKNRLYTVERGNLVEIDVEKGEIRKRYPIPGEDFANDIVLGDDGSIYISDTSPSDHTASRIYRFNDGEFEVWLDSPEISRANGLWIHDGLMLIGNTGDGTLKAVDMGSKCISTVTCLGAGVVDGIRAANSGNYLVSHWEGQIYEITPAGDVVELADTGGEGLNSADFCYVNDRNLLLVPTFLGNSVVAYRLAE